MAFHQAGRLPQAETLYRQILQVNPYHVGALHYLSILAYDAGRNEIAVELMQRVISLKPNFAEAHYNLGNAFTNLGKLDEALVSYGRALHQEPEYVEAHYNMGIVLQGEGKPDEAIASYRRALLLRPDYAEAHNNLGIALKDLGKLGEAIGSFRRALSLRPDYLEAHSNLLFCLDYLPEGTPAHYLEEARQYGQKAAAKAKVRFSDWKCSESPERLRIGLVSDDLRNHPVGYFLESMLANLDLNKIELLAYPVHSKNDELTARIRPRFVDWKPLTGMNDEAAARLILDDGINILVDLSGHTSHNRLPIFTYKPAPVQITWLGYFASTGLAEIDYLLADPVSVPDPCRQHFIEKVWYLPDTRGCFSPPAFGEELPSTPLPALRNGYITFGSFQSLAKLNDDVFAVWGKIFQLMPEARLRLQAPLVSSQKVREQLAQRLEINGITPARVTFEKSAPRKEYLASHADIDIILDTFPFTGYTTTCEALWMGVPTMTLAGETMVNRQGASLLTCAGLTDWIAANEEEYVAKTVAHAADLEKLAKLRSGLRQQALASPLFDGKRFARHFDDALWGMWQQFRKGLE